MAEKKINASEAEVGMIIARPLPDKQGRIILNVGGRLTPAHVKRLEAWGITELFIQLEDAPEENHKADTAAKEQSESMLEQLDKDYINQMAEVFNNRFQEVSDNPFMEKIKKAAFKVVILSGKGGIPALETKS
ncbi:MAG: hypothetical protein ACYTFY_04190 [Planctomycetota bacterium]